MSDSDDTDVLLLIPPDFFLADTGSSSEDIDIANSFKLKIHSPCRRDSKNKLELCNRHGCIDRHPVCIEQSSLTVKPQEPSRETSFNTQMYHSTPKVDRFSSADFGKRKDDFIQEIDNHLQNANGPSATATNAAAMNGDVKRLAVDAIKKHNSLLDNRRTDYYQELDRNFPYTSGAGGGGGTTDSYSKFGRLNDWRNDVNRSTEMKKSLGINDTLLSLNEIWDASGKTESATVHEERTRREVCV